MRSYFLKASKRGFVVADPLRNVGDHVVNLSSGPPRALLEETRAITDKDSHIACPCGQFTLDSRRRTQQIATQVGEFQQRRAVFRSPRDVSNPPVPEVEISKLFGYQFAKIGDVEKITNL